MFEPESERDRLLQQQSGVLIFAAAVQTAQHQKKIDDIGFSAGLACLQCDVIDFEFAQLKLQFGQIRGLARQELCVGKTQQLFLFGMQVQIFIDALHNGGLQAGDLVNFVQKIVSIGCRSESGRLTVEVGWPDQERWQALCGLINKHSAAVLNIILPAPRPSRTVPTGSKTFADSLVNKPNRALSPSPKAIP